ncbi:MAG: beta-galactosidase [Phycisphaerae bacterium]
MRRPLTLTLLLALTACHPAPQTPPDARRPQATWAPPISQPVTLPSIPKIPTHAPATTRLNLGVAWYPEQWPESRWNTDLALMEQAHITVARVGEFAWSSLEPAEGHYHLDWLDRAINLAAKHHIQIVLCTPTDAPPAWLTDKYPDTLRVDETGKRLRHGGRRQFSYTSPRYRDLCKKITAQLAQRFGHNPNVLGWQIGNELTDDSYDNYSKQLFHQYLEQKFKTLDNLNTHWATTYWSQTYFHWNEIPLPTKTDNPGLQLEYKHFVTDMWRSFVADQHQILRNTISPQQWITTNLGGLGWADRFNRFDLSQDLDLISWDAYVGSGHLDANKMAATHDLVRGWKQQNFWVMETQPGSVNWAGINNTLDMGETREIAWQAIGHGADAIAYWQWRSAPNGQEQYHGCLIGADGNPLPIYYEIQQIGEEFQKIAPDLVDTHPYSEVALLHDYDSRWAIDFQPHSNRYDQLAILQDWYRALRKAAGTVDIVSPNADLSHYKLLVAPSLNVISDQTAKKLLAWIHHGGHLLLGPRSGMKDQYNSLQPQRQPGPLANALGAHVEQYYALQDEVKLNGKWGSGHASIWAETFPMLTGAPGMEIIMFYNGAGGGGWLYDHPAVVSTTYGAGRITYCGALLDSDLTLAAAEWAMQQAHVPLEIYNLPDAIEVCRRANPKPFSDLIILLNHSRTPTTFTLPAEYQNYHTLIGPTLPTNLQIELPPHGVLVLQH